MDHTFTITSRIRSSYPSHPYLDIKKAILGSSYVLSLVFVGTTRARKLNQTYRKKDYVPNVLSFPLSSTVGEIYITPAVAASEAKKHHMTERQYIGYLFIHGLLHLKGRDHGATMEASEKKYLTRFGLK